MPSNLRLVVSTVAATAAVAAYYWHQKTKKHRLPAGITKYRAQASLAMRLALEAGRNMLPYLKEQQQPLGINEKSSSVDFSTQVDIDNEAMILQALQKHFSDDCIIGEESVGTGTVPPLTKQPTWIVDPVDGTTNFAAGLPLTCVSIGYCVDAKPVLGVVYVPAFDELYVAVEECGAYCNGQHLPTTVTKKDWNESIVCFEPGYARQEHEIAREVAVLENVMKSGVRAVKTIGSGVLDLVWVATGRLQVVYAGVNSASNWKPWDYCAGMVFIQECQACIETIENSKPFTTHAESIICGASSELVQETRRLILESRKKGKVID